MTVMPSRPLERGRTSVSGDIAGGPGLPDQQHEETMMKAFLKVGMPVAAMVAFAALGAMTGNQANAGEFCRQDVTGHMTGCGFNTMEQCKAASAGIGGDCFRDPFLKDNRDAFAQYPNSPRPKKSARPRGNETTTRP
ncbi:hypothetical protein V1279_005521 [Bradyrhizobium sp. AZCC 1610]|uniref:DUF3551 domain-containing protein n=1 Tax=Bradyrhizobium sp. AZCC 1610 TaxID=3117020 RepID=UPI002FF28D7C